MDKPVDLPDLQDTTVRLQMVIAARFADFLFVLAGESNLNTAQTVCALELMIARIIVGYDDTERNGPREFTDEQLVNNFVASVYDYTEVLRGAREQQPGAQDSGKGEKREFGLGVLDMLAFVASHKGK